MEKYKDKIRQCAVRIQVRDKVGSGFLFVPEKGLHAYIFTVFHVIELLVKGIEKTNFIITAQNKKIDCSISDLEFCILDASNSDGIERLPCDDYKNISEENYYYTSYEASVIRIEKKFLSNFIEVPEIRLWMNKNNIKQGNKFLGMGYPNCHINPLELSGEYTGVISGKKLLQYQSKGGTYDNFVEAMPGFSGSGLVMSYHDEDLVLTGLVLECKENESNHVFEVVCVDEIITCMKKLGWSCPDEYEILKVPESFLSVRINDLLNQDMDEMEKETKLCVKYCMSEINSNSTPVELVQEERFYDIPKCRNGNDRSTCKYYWEGKLWQLFMEMLLEESEGKHYYITDGGKKISFAFICSEGEGNSDIGTVVKSAVKSGVLGNEIKGDCVLFWQSKVNPIRRFYSPTKLKRIVGDIATGDNDVDMRGFHLFSGEMQEKNYGILHRTLLIEKIDGCKTKDDIGNKIKEVLNEIWK